MKIALLSNERVILSSKVGAPNGKPGDLFPQLANGDLTLTSERLIFEPEKPDEAQDMVIPLAQVRSAASGWIRLIDLIPLYPCVEIRTSAGLVHRFAAIKLGTVKPADWVSAIVGAQANLPAEALALAETEATSRAVNPTIASAASSDGAGGASHKFDISTKAPAGPVDDRFAWAIVAVPLAGAAIERWAGSALELGGVPMSGFLMLAANVLLSQVDIRKLTEAGHATPNGWWALLVPVYLWKRAAILLRPQIITLAWIAAFAISLFVGFSTDKSRLADSACPVVTDIIRNQLNGATSCKRVTITEELGGGNYTARATLENGNTIRISIEMRGSDVYVQIPPQ